MTIPVNATTNSALQQSLNNARRDNVAYERAAATTVVENEGEVHKKRAERAKVISETKEAQAKERHEDQMPRSEEHADEQKKGGLTDIYA